MPIEPTGDQGLSTANTQTPLGYRTGAFIGDTEAPIGQEFLDIASGNFANPVKIYKEVLYCNILTNKCGMSNWLEEFGDVQTDCNPAYTLIEKYGLRFQIKVAEDTTIPAYPATGEIVLSSTDHFVNGTYILPRVGNSLILPPYGAIADITAVTQATAYDTVLTVKLRSGVSGTVNLVAGDEPFVLTGSLIEDCEAPEGQFIFEDYPIETDLEMIGWGDKGDICGDALDKCQHWKIDFMNDDGQVVGTKYWNEALRLMYERFEDRKRKEDLFNDKWGIIPTVKAKGLNFAAASNTEITLADVRYWRSRIDAEGIGCDEWAIWAGGDLYSQWMQMLQSEGVAALNSVEQPLNDCKWLNLDWCGVKLEGLTLHIYKNCDFSNGKILGGQSMVFPNSAIWVPMCNNKSDSRKTTTENLYPTGFKNKLFSKVYFRSRATGQVFDALTDSNGILNGPNGRNTFPAGMRQHEWTIQTRYLNELHCANAWGFTGLGT